MQTPFVVRFKKRLQLAIRIYTLYINISLQVFNASRELDEVANYKNIRVFTVMPRGSKTQQFDLITVEQYWDIPTKSKSNYVCVQRVNDREQRSVQTLCISLSYFSFQPVLHDWCNKGRGMCYPVCGMVHIKEPLLLIDKSSLCGDSGFPFSLSEWSLTICLTPYNRR